MTDSHIEERDALPGLPVPAPSWAAPRGKRRVRLEDALAAAIDCEERARRKMRRAFRAWEKAAAALERCNARLTKAVQS